MRPRLYRVPWYRPPAQRAKIVLRRASMPMTWTPEKRTLRAHLAEWGMAYVIVAYGLLAIIMGRY